ncbi:MAG: hypothetical protein ABI884_01060 [Gemmatimonadota bacterium]
MIVAWAGARMFGLSRKKLASLLIESWTHNWEEDPFARGVYSYPTMRSGYRAAKQLSRHLGAGV